MKVAIVHYWLVGMRGGEKVLESLCEMYPDADIFTHVVDRSRLSDMLGRRNIFTSFISRLPLARRYYQKYLPLMPMALEHLDLRGYDLIISSESGPAKGIIPPPSATHVCYCHTPMRYIWNMYHDYRADAGLLARLSMPWLTHYLRAWDQGCASRVDCFVANSRTVAARIQKYYRRRSTVVYPPVEIEEFQPVSAAERGDFYLLVGQLISYKRPDLAIEAFNRLGKRLIVIGDGDMRKTLERAAGPNIEFLGSQPFNVLRDHYARCKALIFPGEEDFGIVPLEAMASGRPVIALGRGGALDTVIDRHTGIFFPDPTADSLIDAVSRFEETDFDPKVLCDHAAGFNKVRFQAELQLVIDQALAENSGMSWLNPKPKPINQVSAVVAGAGKPILVQSLHGGRHAASDGPR